MILPDIVARIPGYDNKMMVDYISLLLKSLNTGYYTIKNEGRGKKKQSKRVYVRKFDVEKETIDRLEKSLKYYNENEAKTLSVGNS
jgi:hypothetical protein